MRRGAGAISMTPADWSFRSASRTGVRLTPNSAASVSCGSRVPVADLTTQDLCVDGGREAIDESVLLTAHDAGRRLD